MNSSISDIISLIKKSKKTLFILCGYPYSGKTYIAQNIIQESDIVYVSIDTIFYAHGFDWNRNHLPDVNMWQTIFDESYNAAEKALLENKNVLYDSTNQTVASRKKLYDLARSVYANHAIVYVKTSPETVWQRWVENNKKQNRSIVDRELVQKTIDMFEEPTNEEGLVYTIYN